MINFFLKKFKKEILFNLFLRRAVLVLIDSILIFASLSFAKSINIYLSQDNFAYQSLDFYLYVIIYGLIFNFFTGQYKSITKYLGNKIFYSYSIRNFLFSLILLFLQRELTLKDNLIFCFLYFLLITYLVIITRLILQDISIQLLRFKDKKKYFNVVIFGAGSAGVQLAANLRFNNNYRVLFFVDEHEIIIGRNIDGIKVQSPKYLKKNSSNINKILFAIPSLDDRNKRRIFGYLSNLNIPILQVPSIDEISNRKKEIDSFESIAIEDILGRSPVLPNNILIKKTIDNKSILVTGAAGSIGSELCKQILNFSPKKLILLDQNEFGLYTIQNELENKFKSISNIEFILGNAGNSTLILRLIEENKINFIFHAAAYKHVPLIEKNRIEGLMNNIFVTKNICDCAYKKNIDKFILISTDKAVRPTNIMGASKRISELIVQSYAKLSYSNNKENFTVFSMVRFGNVLGSSGSVVPLFKQQISKGGPITLTDPNVIRYFMTLKEATQLVLQSSSLSKGGDVLLLDMGKPIKIIDLARKMILLSGRSIKSESFPEGDIEIKKIGLRPGEKLFEELLIDAESIPTEHPLIFRAKEKMLDSDYLFENIKKIKTYSLENKVEIVLDIVRKLVPEYQSSKN